MDKVRKMEDNLDKNKGGFSLIIKFLIKPKFGSYMTVKK